MCGCRLIQARRGYQDMLSTRLSSVGGLLTGATAALVSCAALFEELLPAVGGPTIAAVLGSGASGIPAAAAVYRAALEVAPLEVSAHIPYGVAPPFTVPCEGAVHVLFNPCKLCVALVRSL